MIRATMRAAALAALLTAGGALAQQPAAPAAPAANIAPSHMQAGRELIEIVGINKDDTGPLGVVLNEMRSQVIATFTTTRPELKADLEQVLNGMVPQIAERRQQIADRAATAFATRFTEAEIREIATFLKTPTGAKYLREQPLAFNDFFGALENWIRDLNEFVIVTVRAEMKKKGHDL